MKEKKDVKGEEGLNSNGQSSVDGTQIHAHIYFFNSFTTGGHNMQDEVIIL